MVLGTDLGGGNVDISLVLKVFFEEVCFFMFLFIFYVICFWSIGKKTSKNRSDFGRSKC